MRNIYKKISKDTYVEDYGLYYEDFKIGDKVHILLASMCFEYDTCIS